MANLTVKTGLAQRGQLLLYLGESGPFYGAGRPYPMLEEGKAYIFDPIVASRIMHKYKGLFIPIDGQLQLTVKDQVHKKTLEDARKMIKDRTKKREDAAKALEKEEENQLEQTKKLIEDAKNAASPEAPKHSEGPLDPDGTAEEEGHIPPPPPVEEGA